MTDILAERSWEEMKMVCFPIGGCATVESTSSGGQRQDLNSTAHDTMILITLGGGSNISIYVLWPPAPSHTNKYTMLLNMQNRKKIGAGY